MELPSMKNTNEIIKINHCFDFIMQNSVLESLPTLRGSERV